MGIDYSAVRRADPVPVPGDCTDGFCVAQAELR